MSTLSRLVLERIRQKRQVRTLLRAKGPASKKIFWGFLGGPQKRNLGIIVLEEGRTVALDPTGKALVHERQRMKKFKATLAPAPSAALDEDEVLVRLGVCP